MLPFLDSAGSLVARVKPPGPRRTALTASPVYQDLVGRVASNVRRLRARRGWTHVQAAVRCGIDRTVYKHIERGTGNVTLGTLARLVEGYGVEPGEFLVPAPPPEKRPTGRPRRVRA